MKQSLQLRLHQQLTMTPQLQQAIRLLQLSNVELQQEIQKVLDSNPMLEVKSESDSGNTTLKESIQEAVSLNSSTTPWQGVNNTRSSAPYNDFDFFQNYAKSHSLHEQLLWQINISSLSDDETIIAHALLDGLDNSGFLQTSLKEVQQLVNQQLAEIEIEEIEAVLYFLQHLEPTGVFARSLQESLQLQLAQLAEETPYKSAALALIQKDLEHLSQYNLKQLAKQLKISTEELSGAIELVQSLSSSPADQLDYNDVEYVTPDILVRKVKGRWQAELNTATLPQLRINSIYSNMVRTNQTDRDSAFFKDNLQEARWFLKSIQSRNETLLKVANCIVQEQYDFFEQGEEGMKPLVLQHIAQAIDMHESTVSRVTTQKYMLTPRGVFELKYFFSSHINSHDGNPYSSTAIRALIKKIIAGENPKKPLSDNKVALLLQEQGIDIARRTVAKYREAMNIPPSKERKRLL
ncbi:RNA polymerase factor sigma-54 [Piscirickettsia litoralis]|uniref:RNA polymerase sigma-54 factor n=1 Tax=Piscirickettsia litoralis TaxID=1891921 RepID=A0ABX3A118_9GAMM|nr:RNA polymerase factor sigma-54 [Piscirickettsia litoralis]ODN42508.1 RNA polymerase factor sigma-54 [Piscirickettsia litoralis]